MPKRRPAEPLLRHLSETRRPLHSLPAVAPLVLAHAALTEPIHSRTPTDAASLHDAAGTLPLLPESLEHPEAAKASGRERKMERKRSCENDMRLSSLWAGPCEWTVTG